MRSGKSPRLFLHNVSLVRNRLHGFATAVTHFSANINRIALLRNSRDNGLPDLVACARIVLDAPVLMASPCIRALTSD